ncbi:MAG: AAA family ATPase [Dehalococcoidia bacterium]|nr:AAA family ATPase [Dehalococcoidia bacterium]
MRDALNLLTPVDGRPTPYRGGSADVPRSVEYFKAALLSVADSVPGRMQLLQQTALALLTRRHQLLISRAGTGKSLYGESVFGHFQGDVFKAQFSQGTRLETILGGLDLKLFQEGKLWHNTTRSLVTADFAYLDEFMNASDVVLEALLGILNERRFVQGEQQEEARLHSALAMTNHLKFSAISEPVLDRFLFKASIAPQGDALNDILIDLAYARHHGRAEQPDHPLPLDILRELSDIVTGTHPQRSIDASHAILFLKNEVIESYTHLAAARARVHHDGSKGPGSGDGYVSPRTKAASRDVLNASALLHHRAEVDRSDLHTLRFVLTTIPGNDRAQGDAGQDIFTEALYSTLRAFTEDDLQTVQDLTTIAQTFSWFVNGTPLEAQQAHSRVVRFFLTLIGKTNWHEVTYDTFIDALRGREIANPRVNALRESILEDVLELSRRAH